MHTGRLGVTERDTRPVEIRRREYWNLRAKMPGTPYYRLPPDWHFLASTVVAVLYLVVAGVVGGAQAVARMFAFLILPILCIWFPSALGSLMTSLPTLAALPINRPSPAGLLRFIAWLALMAPVIGLVVGVFFR